MQTDFGKHLRQWRNTRRMSQLDLALTANVSARHISFLETGRARPSNQMVIQLANTLDIPRGSRNQMLSAAGFANLYRGRSVGDADLAQVRAALDRMITSHDPLPAFVLDRHWHVVSANQGFSGIAAQIDLGVGDSLLDTILNMNSPEQLVVNWPEFASHLHARLRTESAHLGGDLTLDQAADQLAARAEVAAFRHTGIMPAVIPTRLRQGDQVLTFFSTIAQIGSTEDIILADLRIEMLFPADDQTAALYGATLNPPIR